MKTYTVTGMTYSYARKAWEVTPIDVRYRSHEVEAAIPADAVFTALGYEPIRIEDGVAVFATGTRYRVEEV